MVRNKAQAVKLNVNVPKKRQPRVIAPKWISLNTTCQEELLIGTLLVGSTWNHTPETWLTCRVSFLCVSDEVDRINLEFDEITVVVTLYHDTQLLKEIFTANVFSFKFTVKEQDLCMYIFFRELPLPRFNTKIGNALKTVFEISRGIRLSTSELPQEAENDDVQKNIYGAQEKDQLYKLLSLSRSGTETFDFGDVQHPSLNPILRPYQINAVKWMLSREKQLETEEDMLHPLYILIQLPSGTEIYFDKFSGHVTTTKPLVSRVNRGGILAEEMGLGKTVEFLALVLNNPFTSSEVTHSSSTEQNEDSEEMSDNDNVDLPVFRNQTKKISHRKKRKLIKNDKNYEYEVKDIKVPKDWVKPTKRQSSIRTALQHWYNKELSAVNQKNKPVIQTIQCICGETYSSGKIKCVDCGKFQHKDCLGYATHYGEFRCPSCWLEAPLVETGATLIVTPVSLRTQWCNEIKKHVSKKLRVLVYEGSNKTPVYPTYFKQFDVVITTYNVLQAEFRLTEKAQVCELRRKRKYDFQGTPLSRIKWWRLCLDEAQTVETPGKIVSEMAKKLTANFRWAVTGTPISKNISDLFGLIGYLEIEPYNELETWTNVLYTPYFNGNVEPLCTFLSKVMWRSTKSEVIDQVGIPEQIVKEHILEFSAVEKFFYNKEHELCSEAFIATLKNMDTSVPLVKLDKGLLKKIMVPLVSLRQVCTHPNSERGKYLATRKKVSTMKELLDALILKNTNECEEHLRVIVSSLNGLAGIYLLMKNPLRAAEMYRKVMQLSARFSDEKSENNLAVDKLQLIHTMHNLAELLDSNKRRFPKTLHDATLRDDCKILEQKYIQKFINSAILAYQESSNAKSSMEKLQLQFSLKIGQWYSDGIDWIAIENFMEELTAKIRNMHETVHGIICNCLIDVTSERTILYNIAKWDEEVTDFRADLIEIINKLFTYKDEECKIVVAQKIVEEATDCHLRPEEREERSSKKKKKCSLCRADDYLKKYESKLYHMTKRKAMFEDMSLQGSWKPTSQEIMLKAISMLLKAKNAPTEIVKDGEIHMNMLDTAKKEFKEIRKLWTHIYQQVSAQDELDMCKIKLRLEDPRQEKKSSKDAALKRLSYIVENKLTTHYIMNESELDYHMMLLTSDEAAESAKLEKSLGVKSYLETLRKQQYEGVNPDPCPICTNMVERHWSILPCGHNYCMDCLHKLIKKMGFGKLITCCVCRRPQVIQDISYIRSTAVEDESTGLEIKGNFSTKIEATIKLIMELKEKDENVKVLVFSTWVSVLKFLREALIENNVKNEILLSSKLEERIEHFKDEKEKVTALLLPINLGGKGLNLIEATHVILMEPLLNPGEELQAIGRVHRIGQTKPTFVHKLCIKNTIEESILTATSTDAEKWDRSKVTLNQLKNLFEKVNISDYEEDNTDMNCDISASEDQTNNVEPNPNEHLE